MISTRARLPFISALFALMVGLFVLAPLGEALACGPELADPATDVLTAAQAAHDDADDCTPSHCAHGHCHAPGSLPPQSPDAIRAWSAPVASGLPPEADHASACPDGLIRPPRA